MENTAPASPKAILIESNSALRDISQLVALTGMTEAGLENLQGRTGTTRNFSHSVVIPDQTRTGVNSFKLENPDTEAIFEALKAAGRQVVYLRETGEIAPAFPQNGIPAPGQPHLTSVREWTYDPDTHPTKRGFKSAATITLANGRKADVYFAAERKAFVPQNSVVLHDKPADGP
jgi:hypothetical protein